MPRPRKAGGAPTACDQIIRPTRAFVALADAYYRGDLADVAESQAILNRLGFDVRVMVGPRRPSRRPTTLKVHCPSDNADGLAVAQ